MAKVFPFKPLTYDPVKAGALEKVVTQPYDKISGGMQERYYAANEFNLVRIILGKQFPSDTEIDNVYTRAGKYFREWIALGVLRQGDRPGFYAYSQEYELPGSPGTRLTREGFIGLGLLEDYSSGIVYPHEQTLSGPKEDRLKLLRQTRAHFGQIFMLYSDPRHATDALLKEVSSRKPDIRVVDEFEVVHSLWRIEDPGMLHAIQRQMEDMQLIIADGHHRYETALNFRDECRASRSDPGSRSPAGEPASFEKVMMTFINMENPGLTILPTHRLVSNLPGFGMKDFLMRLQEFFSLVGFKFFTPQERETKFQEFRHELREVGKDVRTLGLRVAGTPNFYLLKLKGTLNLQRLLPEVPELQRGGDVVLLHKIILEKCLGISDEEVRSEKHIRYVREFEEASQAIEKGEAQLAFFLNPTPIEQVREIAFAGQRLPQKSTDFYPKLLSGLTIYRLDEQDPG